ncbi:HSP20-like chaperone [Rhodocollybia butyracea]|uniref:HSP20-like chaperone n=1 Tax=Rhodocollybia butyracea TaxID=206335 RepID=A0A9P5Q2W1_9AGAR|nr:HSP20-like chaperone [Rhodocollybia butyracea]
MSIYFYEPSYNWDRLFDETFGSPFQRGGQGRNQSQALTERSDTQLPRFLRPKMDLHEDKEKNLVTATFEFPGVQKEDVQIDLHNGRLTVAAETKLSGDREHEGYAVRERSFGKFSRTLQLPEGVKEEEVKASMDHGVLTVTFPKAGAEQTPKKITVS